MTLKNKDIFSAIQTLNNWFVNIKNLQSKQGLIISVAQETYFSSLMKNLIASYKPCEEGINKIVDMFSTKSSDGSMVFQEQEIKKETDPLLDLQVEIAQSEYPKIWNESIPSVPGFNEFVVTFFSSK